MSEQFKSNGVEEDFSSPEYSFDIDRLKTYFAEIALNDTKDKGDE